MTIKKHKKITALVLAVLIAISCIPIQVLASETSNDTNINLKWDFIVEVNTILLRYTGKADPTNEEIESAVLSMDYETYMSAQADIEGVKLMLKSLSDEEQEQVLNTDSVEKLGYMEDVMIKLTSPMLLSGESANLCDGNVTAKVDSNGTLTESSGTVTVTAKGSMFSKKTATVTITNNSSVAANVSFDYSLSSQNSYNIDGTTPGTSGTYSKQLAAGATISFVIQSKSGLSGTTVTLTLKNFNYVVAKDSSAITFDYDSSLGSVSLDGTVVADGYVAEISKDGATLTATPNSGVTFLGWTDANGIILSKETTFTYSPFSDGTVKAVFTKNTACFGVGSSFLSDSLAIAVNYAQTSGTNVIYLANNGTLAAGDYTIPAGVTLLIPFDSANTTYTDKPAYITPSTDNPYVKPTAYRTLIMASGANLVVNGALSIPAKHVGMSGAQVGKGNAPTGSVGLIKMETNSNITVNNGGNLYAYGYITGSGNVVANSGAKVYEYFQVGDFPGGSNTSKLTDAKKVFLFSQYYVQNIEVPLRINSGAQEVAVATMDTGLIDKTTTLTFISSSNAMFVLNSGYVEKRYDGTKDRLIIDVYGSATMSPINFDVATGLTSISISSADYALPLTHSISVNAKSGSSFTINQDLALLPGSEITIDEGANGVLGSGVSVYVYDVDSWGAYIFAGNSTDTVQRNTRFLAPPYAPGRINARTESSLKDAEICINGSFDATNGFVYTTSNATGTSTSLTTDGGANIYSTKNGKIYVTPSANVTTYQFDKCVEDVGINYVDVTAEQAKLKNADGSFTYTTNINDSGVECKVFVYENGTWVHHDFDSTGTCTVCGSKSPALDVKDSNGAIDHSALYAYTVETVKPADAFTVVNGGTMEVVPNELGFNNATGSKILVEKADGTILKTYTVIVFGDVNGDGTVDGFDAIEIDLAINGLTDLTDIFAIAADVNADGVVNKTDYDMVCSVASLQSVLENPMATSAATVNYAASQAMPVMTAEACAHNYEEEVIAPTCTTKGYSVFTCSLCGHSYEANEINATGHKSVKEDDDVPATCLATGLKSRWICTVCKEVTTPEEEIPALGHNMVSYDAKPATYSSVGWNAYEKCSLCGESTYEEIPMLETPLIEDYETFAMYLGLLETLAYMYSMEVPETDPAELVIKYIRTGVDRYNSGSWEIMAGKEDTEFAKYVAVIEDGLNINEPDTSLWIAICSLKNLGMIAMPNGEAIDVGHMFGVMDITYHNMGSQNHADVSGWAGDIVDLINDTADGWVDGLNQAIPVTGTVEEMTAIISEYYLAAPDAHCEDGAFSIDDMKADLDGFYFMETVDFVNYTVYEDLMCGDLTVAFMAYYTEELNDVQRAKFYLENRLGTTGTREEIRNEVYLAYTGNKMIATLEDTKQFKVDDISDLRVACCYAFADYVCRLAGDYVENNNNNLFKVHTSDYSTLAPGINQTIKKATTADGKQMVYYLATADINRDDVNVYANYGDNDPTKGWQMQTVEAQMRAAQKNNADIENFNVIAGVNGSGFNMGTGEPAGLLIMDGVVYQDINSAGFFGIDYDGNAVIGTKEEYNTIYKGKIKEAISGFSSFLIKDGKICTTDNSTRASRTAVGITATGKVVFMVLDGRQEPVSCGGSMLEIAQILYEAGCVQAVNLDGGGSTTYVAKQEGADDFSVVNKPSDGFARSVSTSWYIASTAPSSTAFDHAIIESDYDFATKNSTVKFTAKGVSATGNEAVLPDGVYWAVDNENNAAITSDGVLTALKNDETITVYLMLGDEILATKTVTTVTPTSIYFSRTNVNVIYGQGYELPIIARFGNKKVAFNTDDINFKLSNNKAGAVEGFTFVGNENSGVKNVIVTAELAADSSITAEINLVLNKLGEATFDFDNATGGNRLLAWHREVSNATTTDNVNYEIVDKNEDMVTTYAFAIDMTQLEIPQRLQDIVYMLPGAGEADASAWKFLLQLAERVSAMTTVSTTVTFDKNFDVDYSDIKIVSDYFELTDKSFDEETNTLTVKLNWIKQTQAIDPAMANPICIVSGAKVTPKETANWDANNKLNAVAAGKIDYKIYLRANALYTFATKPENQEVFGLYPFVNPDIPSEKGGYFEDVHATFEDKYTLICANNDGWVNVDGGYAYYKGGEKLTGVHKIDGYYYDFDENGVNVGKTKYTGLLFDEELKEYRYAQAGEPVSGWQQIGEDWYYFNSLTQTALVGEAELFGGVIYTFEETGKLSSGVWAQTLYGMRYYYGPGCYEKGWYNIDGKDYCFEKSIRFEDGYYAIRESNISNVYHFNEDGSCDKSEKIPDGFYTNKKGLFYSKDGVPLKGTQCIDGDYYYFDHVSGYAKKDCTASGRIYGSDYKGITGIREVDGTLYYYAGGKPTTAGLVCIDGDYYFAGGSKGELIVNQRYYTWETNGLLPKANREFGPDGKMYDGIVEKNGTLYYYELGEPKAAGLVYIDGDYYFAGGSKGELIVNQNYYTWETNGLLPKANREFGPDGKMYNGIVEKDGTLYYYDLGQPKTAGLVCVDGDYYFAGGSKGEVIVNQRYYTWETNGLMSKANREFGPDGKMYDGIVEKDGILYYYELGQPKTRGLVYIDGNYYFAGGSKGELIVDQRYYTWETNGLMSKANREFGPDGKMLDGIVEKDGTLYYYVLGQPKTAGLICIDGDYYFAGGSKGELIVNQRYYTWQTNDLLPKANREFGPDGKMLDGIVEKNGTLYYYELGQPKTAGLVCVDGDYYFAHGRNGEIAIGKQYVWEPNGLMSKGNYEFGEDGKMLNGFITRDGEIYYYENGKYGNVGLNYIDGYYYFIDYGGLVIRNRDSYYVWDTNGLSIKMNYAFDEYGRVIV